MAATLAGAVKAQKTALLAQMQDRAGLASVQVSWGHPGDDINVNETVFLHDTRAETEYGQLRASRPKRDGEFEIDVVVQVGRTGNEQTAVEQRALDLAAEVEEAVFDDTTLGGSCVFCRVASLEQTNVKPESRTAWLSQVVVRVEGLAHIT